MDTHMQYWPDWSCHWNYDKIDWQYCKSRHLKCWKELEYALRAKWVGQIVCDLVPLKSNWKTVSTKLIYIILWPWHTKYLNGQCGFIIYFVNCNLWISVTINGWGNGGRQLAQLEFTVTIWLMTNLCTAAFLSSTNAPYLILVIQFNARLWVQNFATLWKCWQSDVGIYSIQLGSLIGDINHIEILWAGISGHLWDMVTRY